MKQSGFNVEQINKDKNPESKNRLKIKIASYHNRIKTVRLSNQRVITREDHIPLKVPAYLANRHAHGILYVRTSAGSSTMRNRTRNIYWLASCFSKIKKQNSQGIGRMPHIPRMITMLMTAHRQQSPS